MKPLEIQAHLQNEFGNAVSALHEEVTEGWIGVEAGRWLEIAKTLKHDPALAFDMLMCVSGVDEPPDHLECSYFFYSHPHRHRIAIKIRVSKEDPVIPSAAGVWSHANWMEREAFDLLGIVFQNHPDLRRILLPEDWVGYPLRKDYQEPEEYQGIVTWREDLRGKDPNSR